MPVLTSIEPQWPKRLAEIDSPVDEIRLPETNGDAVAQDEEWCEAVIDGNTQRFRFHDYHQLYRIPGLYEGLFYENLKCCSPSRVVSLLEELLLDFDEDPQDLRVLDLGAGNGMVGDELRARDAQSVVGVDIIPEARQAALRDRPGVYDDYLVTDMTELPEQHEEKLRRREFNCLTSVAALGFGDIPPKAFLKALDMIEVGGWAAFTIKEDFLRHDDTSGFSRLVMQLNQQQILQTQAYRRFQHRLSITGEPLYYVVVVAKKQAAVPGEWLEADDALTAEA
jgi:SAM-dependent methyltransferase